LGRKTFSDIYFCIFRAKRSSAGGKIFFGRFFLHFSGEQFFNKKVPHRCSETFSGLGFDIFRAVLGGLPGGFPLRRWRYRLSAAALLALPPLPRAPLSKQSLPGPSHVLRSEVLSCLALEHYLLWLTSQEGSQEIDVSKFFHSKKQNIFGLHAS